jgi:hypothetical protein
MMSLISKLTIVSGFVAALVVYGGGLEERRAAASESPSRLDAIPQASPEAPVVPHKVEPTPSTTGPLLPRPAGAPLDLGSPGEAAETPQDAAASSFASEMLRLSVAADGVDRLWQAYKERCGVRVSRRYDFGREWFAVWDRAADPTLHAPGCGDLLVRVREAGEKVRRETVRARAKAHQARGTEIGMLRWHGLLWPPLQEESPQRPPKSGAK